MCLPLNDLSVLSLPFNVSVRAAEIFSTLLSSKGEPPLKLSCGDRKGKTQTDHRVPHYNAIEESVVCETHIIQCPPAIKAHPVKDVIRYEQSILHSHIIQVNLWRGWCEEGGCEGWKGGGRYE